MQIEAAERFFRQGVIVDFIVIFRENGIFVKYFLNNGDFGFLVGADKNKGYRLFRTLDAAFRTVEVLGKHEVMVKREQVGGGRSAGSSG